MYVLLEMKISSGDSIADMSYSCPSKVRPPKGCEHSRIEVRQDLNNLVIFTHTHTHIIKIHYIITFDKWNTWDTLHPCVYFLKKKYRGHESLSCHYLQTPTQEHQNLFVGGDLSKAVFILAAVPRAGNCISPSNYTPYKELDVHRSPLRSPKSPQKRGSNFQLENFGRTHQ